MKRDYAFVDFEDYHHAGDAISKMDGKTVDGHKLTVQPASAERKHSHGPSHHDICYNCGQRGHWY
jgi:RNA recognition motif-containing protein